MYSRTVGTIALAASALTAQAILLPPGVASVDGPNRISDWAVDTVSQAIKLPCSECAFSMNQGEKTESTDGEDFVWIQGGANSVMLNFSVVDAGKSMALNGKELYPPTFSAEQVVVEQVASSASLIDIKTNKVSTRPLTVSGSNVFINEDIVAPAGDSVVRVTYQITSLEQQRVSVDGVEVTMLKDAAGEMQILSVEAVPRTLTILDSFAKSSPSELTGAPEKECSMLPAFMCKWKNVVENKVGNIKAGMPKHFGGCAGKKGGMKLSGHIKPDISWEGDENDKPSHHHGRPPVVGRPHERPHGTRPGRPNRPGRPGRPHHGHHRHGHHGHHSHFLHRLFKGFVMILIPIMAGITMGMTVSLVGMLVGKFIAFVWIKFRRGGQRGYASVTQEDEETQAAEKGQINLTEAEPLPVYEEAPAYEETERK